MRAMPGEIQMKLQLRRLKMLRVLPFGLLSSPINGNLNSYSLAKD